MDVCGGGSGLMPRGGDTYTKPGLTAATPFLAVPDIAAAIAWYTKVFAATEVRRDADPGGVVRHALIRIDDAIVELGQHSEAAKTVPPALPPVGVHLYVPDVDAVWQRALAAGASGNPPADMPYADREALVADPFGITWYVATYVGTTTE
jgi:PhnB protein